MKYPWTIRNDAITAVGAPSSIEFILRALYWLYLLATLHTKQVEAIIQSERKEEESALFGEQEDQEMKAEDTDLYKQLLDDVLV